MAEGSNRALIVVDMQNDFADPRGSLYVRGADSVLRRVNREIRDSVDARLMVVYTQDWHPESTPHFAKDGGVWPVHCVAGSWGAQLHPDLVVATSGRFVLKGVGGEDGYSGFSVRDAESGDVRATELDEVLRGAGVVSVFVVGLATDYCVKETVLDARRLGYAATVMLDCMAAVNVEPRDGARAIAEMVSAGAEVVGRR